MKGVNSAENFQMDAYNPMFSAGNNHTTDTTTPIMKATLDLATKADLEAQQINVVKSFSFVAKLKATLGTAGAYALIGFGGLAILGGAAAGILFGVVFANMDETVTFRLVHLNDMHARVEGINSNDAGASSEDRLMGNRTDGGWPKIFTAAKQLVDNTSNPVLFMEAGDQHMGTIWHTYYKGREAYEFLNVLCSDREAGGAGFDACVGTLGNHEFDGQYYQVLEYARKINYTMVLTNIQDDCKANQFGSMETGELGKRILQSTIIELPNEKKTKVGVVGYLTPTTTTISSTPSCLLIHEESALVQAAVEELRDQGVTIIIALGHSGIDMDKSIALAVPDIDIIVGGHSHTFLWEEERQGQVPGMTDSGIQLTVDGTYPTLVDAGSSTVGIPIVQAYWGSRFLGAIDLTFDKQGNLVSYTPQMVLLGDDGPNSQATHKFEDDPVAVDIINKLAPPLETFKTQVTGFSIESISAAPSQIRTSESRVGNLICDAMFYYLKNESNFGDVDFCMINSGAIGGGINAGDITIATVLSILPFNNFMTVLELTGRQLYIMAENGLSRYPNGYGEFPQIGQFHIAFDSEAPAACSASGVPKACTGTVEPTRVFRLYDNRTGLVIANDNTGKYKLVTNEFVGRGGDGYKILKEAKVLLGSGVTLEEALRLYMKSFLPGTGMRPKLADRLVDCAVSTSHSFCFATEFDAYTKISSIYAGEVNVDDTILIRGIVTQDMRSQYTGFYLQANRAQHFAPSAFSEAIFVDCQSVTSPVCDSSSFREGSEIEVNGTVSATGMALGTFKLVQREIEFVKVLCKTPTKVLPGTSLLVCDSVNIRSVTFPVLPPADLDATLTTAYGMLIDFSLVNGTSFAVTDNSLLGEFGEVALSGSGGILPIPTQIAHVGPDSEAVFEDSLRKQLVLDDASAKRAKFPTLYPKGGVADSSAQTLRAASLLPASALRGSVILEKRFNEWRLQPNSFGKSIIPESFQPGPENRAPPDTDTQGLPENNKNEAYLRIVGMNVLNYFIQFTENGCSSCRGAPNAALFAIQAAKLYEAIRQMRPAIMAIQEMQNGDAASDVFVNQLNAYLGNGTYDQVRTGTLGSDVIKVAIVYDTSLVTPVGVPAILSYTNPSGSSRPSVAQTFVPICSNDPFTVVSNHLKSRGGDGCSSSSDCDFTSFGEGNFANARFSHATQLKEWIESDPTGSGSDKFILLGDFNAYRFERPITLFTDDNWVDLASRDHDFPFSYQFEGRFGTLDYGLASPSMATACNATLEWHINSLEPVEVAYTQFGVPASPFRASDHDPLIVGCKLTAPVLGACTSSPTKHPTTLAPTTLAPTRSPAPFSLFINEFHADNEGTDLDEFIEIAVRKGVELEPDQVVIQLLNGNVPSNQIYLNTTLATFEPGSTYCAGTPNEFTLYYRFFESAVIQNGGTVADGIALGLGTQLFDFISYFDSLQLVGGANTIAAGVTSTAVGVSGAYEFGNSIQRVGFRPLGGFDGFTWALKSATPGEVNEGQAFQCE